MAINYGVISQVDPTLQPTDSQQGDLNALVQNIEGAQMTSTTGTEFGEVDRAAGAKGLTGKWGHNLAGFDNEGVALPDSILKNYGDYNDSKFADNFNANFDVVVQDPNSGTSTTTGLKDIGPRADTGAGIDLLGGTRTKLGLDQNFRGAVNYKIVPKGTTASLDGGDGAPPAMPDLIDLPATTFTKGRGNNSIQNIILHSSDGTEKGDLEQLTHNLSAHYYVTRDGRVYNLVKDQDTAWHAGKTIDDSKYGNAATLGIEQEHIDGKQDWPDAQVQATAGLVANLKSKYGLGNNNILGHSNIAPERKVDPINFPWEKFNQIVAGRGGRATSTGTQATALDTSATSIPWDLIASQALVDPTSITLGNVLSANQKATTGQPVAQVQAGGGFGTVAGLELGTSPGLVLPQFSRGAADAHASTRPEFFGMRVASNDDVQKYDQYVSNGNDPNAIDPYDRLAIALNRDPKFLTKPENVGVLQEMVLNPISQQQSRISTGEKVSNAISGLTQGIVSAAGDVGNYFKTEMAGAVPSMRYLFAKATGQTPDNDSTNAFINEGALAAQGIAKTVSDVNSFIGNLGLGVERLDTNIGLSFTNDPVKRAELEKQYALLAQKNAAQQDGLYDLGSHLQSAQAQVYTWLGGTADVAHRIATEQPDPSAVEGFSQLAQLGLMDVAGAAAGGARGMIKIFRPQMFEKVLQGAEDASVAQNIKYAYDRTQFVPRNAAEEASNVNYQAGRNVQNTMASASRTATQQAADAQEALAQKLTSLTKISGDPGSATQFVGQIAQTAGNAMARVSEISEKVNGATDKILTALSGGSPELRGLYEKAVRVALFSVGAHGGHAMWGRLFETAADAAEELPKLPKFAQGMSDLLKIYGKEKLYGETTIPFFTRLSQGTKLLSPRLASMLDSSAIQSIYKMGKGAATGVAVGIPVGALSDPNDPIAGAVGMGGMGGLFGMAGAGFHQWMKYDNPGTHYQALRGDWKRTRDMMSKSDQTQFGQLSGKDQLMIGTFAQQHPGLKINFINDPKGLAGLHYVDETGKSTVQINTANPESTVRALFAHEFTHDMKASGMLPDVYDALLGNVERGTKGQYTATDVKGEPLGVDPQTGRYISNQDFANLKAKYLNGLARAGEPTAHLSDLDIAREIFSEHGVDYLLSPKSYVDATSAFRPSWMNTEGMKKALASVGFGFDANGMPIRGSGLFDGLVRNDALDKVLSKYMRTRFNERKVGGSETDNPTRVFRMEDLRKTAAADTFLDSAPEIMRNADGSVKRDANTGLPLMRTKAQVKEYNGKLASDIFDRIDALPEDQKVALGAYKQPNGALFMRYMPSEMLDALAKTNQYNPHQLAGLRALSEMLADNSRMGTNFRIFYHKALSEGKRYGGFSGSEKFVVPYGFEVTGGDNVNLKSVDFSQINQNFLRNNKRAPFQELWKGDVGEFTQDVHRYFQNHAEGLHGEDSGIGIPKKDAINSLMGFETTLHKEANPLVSQTKGVRSIVKSYRIDRASQITPLEKTSPFNDEAQYRKMNMNFRPRVAEEAPAAESVSQYPPGASFRPRTKAAVEATDTPTPEAVPVTYRTTASGKTVANTQGYGISDAPLVANKQPTEAFTKDSPNNFGHIDFLGPLDQKRLTQLDSASATSQYADKIIKEYAKWKSNPDVMSAKTWYRDVRGYLEKSFGKDSELFAHLLAVTSPQQGVVQNWHDALEAYHRYKLGFYDDAIAEFKRTGKITEDMKPTKANGQKFGLNSDGVLRALSGTWLDTVAGPKTPNFFDNLFGRGTRATIDKWAGRTMRRLGFDNVKGAPEQWRLTPKSEAGVSDLDFAFSQEAFEKAAKRVGMDPHELQAVMWYAEKHHWAAKGWAKGGAQAAKASYVPMLKEYSQAVGAGRNMTREYAQSIAAGASP